MNDRELLEFAAKAAGYELLPVPWNPLTDDGDALRLAVKLGLLVNIVRKTSGYPPFSECTCEDATIDTGPFDHGNDPYTATRRAIVRAAAEIGKTNEVKHHSI